MMDNVLAKKIIQELGGVEFSEQTGAHDFAYSHKEMFFRLPVQKDSDLRFIFIGVEPGTEDDVYYAQCVKTSGGEVAVVAEVRGIYCDHIRQAVEEII